MKKLIVASLTLLTIFAGEASIAGTPDEDLVVANLRLRFKAGRQPSVNYLVSRTFSCTCIVAEKGRFEKNQERVLTFDSFDQFVRLDQFPSSFDESYGVLFSFNGKELIASTLKNPYTQYLAYRVDSSGTLIGEYSWPEWDMKELSVDPISASKGKVLTYHLCIPKIKPTENLNP